MGYIPAPNLADDIDYEHAIRKAVVRGLAACEKWERGRREKACVARRLQHLDFLIRTGERDEAFYLLVVSLAERGYKGSDDGDNLSESFRKELGAIASESRRRARLEFIKSICEPRRNGRPVRYMEVS